MKHWPTLYKLTSAGKVEEWELWVEGSTIYKKYGLQDGKKQIVTDEIKEGKNLGQSNATTPIEQALLEAESLYKKKKEGMYRDTIEEVMKDKDRVKKAGSGGYLPMLAEKYSAHKTEVWSWKPIPLGQFKLDGIRCIACCEKTGVELWFRSGKKCSTMGHLITALEKVMQEGEIWDGELFTQVIDFHKIQGAISSEKNLKPEEAKLMEYHIYDFPRILKGNTLLKENIPYIERMEAFKLKTITFPLVMVKTETIRDEGQLEQKYNEYVGAGYEGVILRNPQMAYLQKRTINLIKHKKFIDEEFKVIGYIKGKGTLAGAVGAFIVQLPNGKTCKVKMKGLGITAILQDYLKYPEKFMNKLLTVQYQGYDSEGRLRFPVGKCIREDL